MKYLLLIAASFRRRPMDPILSLASTAIAFLLAGLTLGFARVLPHADDGTMMAAAGAIASLGFAMILFLTGNALAQSVRARRAEFAVMRALGFSTRMIIALVWTEVLLPCLLGAVAGLALTELAALGLSLALPFALPRPFAPLFLWAGGLAITVLLALVAAAPTTLRLARLDVAAALAGR
jgi:putative ABC transport system permease protein